MAGRAPRPGGAMPRPTRSQMLRQAKSAAIVQKVPAQPAAAGRGGPPRGRCPGPRTGFAQVAPPPAPPKRVDIKNPGMTKAMQLRRKQSEEKMRKDAEAQQRLEAAKRRPKRTAAPPGGDARMARPRPPPPAETPGLARVRRAIDRGHVTTRRGGYPEAELDGTFAEAIARGRGAIPKRRGPGRGPLATATPRADVEALARSMNANIAQAVPNTGAPVDMVIIPPGAVDEGRNTVVYIAPPRGAANETAGAASRSIAVIAETLDMQDAAETATVQGRLDELQQARRDFVMAVANVGGNAVNIADGDDEGNLSILDPDEMADAIECIPSPPKQRTFVRCPDLSHEMFQVEYGDDHPDLVAAKEFNRRAAADRELKERQRRIEDDFARAAQAEVDDLRFDVPIHQDFLEGDISFEEDEEGYVIPCPSRIKASMPPIPRKTGPCPERPIDVEEIERFFNIEKYPGEQCPVGAPPGREGLHPDLWEIDDPWYREATQPEQSDLMRFDTTY